jgi:hypothetical protein
MPRNRDGLYALKMSAYSGMTYRIAILPGVDEGTWGEAHARAMRKTKYHKDPTSGDFHAEVSTLVPNRKWEICEPEGWVFVPDWCGIMEIVPASDPELISLYGEH